MSLSSMQHRHLLFLRYIWIAAPFLMIWLWTPGLDIRLGQNPVEHLRNVSAGVLVYMAIRTGIALKGPALLRWELVFAVTDVAAVAVIISAACSNPLSNLSALYLLAILEVSESLSIPWLLVISLLITVSELVATRDHRFVGLFGQVYPFVFIFFAAFISGLLALSAAKNREQLAVVNDRARISHEMHDGVQGHLVTIASQLELLSHLVRSDPEKAIGLAKEGRNLARLAADELRYLVQRLRSPSLESGFSASLIQFAFNITQREQIDLDSNLVSDAHLSANQEHTLFRIAQEAITNAIRHGSPTRIRLTLTQDEQGVELTIEDDGKGFDPSREQNSGLHSGLASMKARAEGCHGMFAVRSSALQGTAVSVKVPTN